LVDGIAGYTITSEAALLRRASARKGIDVSWIAAQIAYVNA
jgi:hypothetical protein